MYRYAILFTVVLLFLAAAGTQLALAANSPSDAALSNTSDMDLESDGDSVVPDLDQLPDGITVTHSAMIPEPATLSLLGFGSLVLLRRRK